MATGPDHRYLLPNAALLGAVLLVGADMISRTLIAPAELPIGIVTATLGAPVFLWILLRRRGLGGCRMLIATGLGVRLGNRAILQDVDFTAHPGAVTAIVGPNGSGKTTLLRALSGDLRHTGSARLNGIVIAGAKPWVLAAQRAVLAQASELAFPFTVQELVRLGLLSGTEAARGDLLHRALAEVGLTGYASRSYHDLSGGEQQRVHLARVLVQVWEPVTPHGPRWLFLDEPVSSLDIGHQLLVMRIARRYADAGGGVVAVMHDLNLTAMFADQIALMQAGRLVVQGAPAAVLTDAHLGRAYGCAVRINTPPASGPWLVPQAMAG